MDFQTPSLALAWNSRGLRLLWYGFPDVFVSFGMVFQTPSFALAWYSRRLLLLRWIS